MFEKVRYGEGSSYFLAQLGISSKILSDERKYPVNYVVYEAFYRIYE